MLEDLEETPPEKEKKKLFKKVLHEILSYHILPDNINSQGLASNISFPTSLKPSDGSFSGQARRIRLIGPVFHGRGGIINLYSKIKKADILAQNGNLLFFFKSSIISIFQRGDTCHQSSPYTSLFNSRAKFPFFKDGLYMGAKF